MPQKVDGLGRKSPLEFPPRMRNLPTTAGRLDRTLQFGTSLRIQVHHSRPLGHRISVISHTCVTWKLNTWHFCPSAVIRYPTHIGWSFFTYKLAYGNNSLACMTGVWGPVQWTELLNYSALVHLVFLSTVFQDTCEQGSARLIPRNFQRIWVLLTERRSECKTSWSSSLCTI